MSQNERYNCGYNKGYVDAQRDWNSQRWTPPSGGDSSCPHVKEHTFECCNGYQVGYTASWNNLIKQSSQNPSSNHPASNSPQSPILLRLTLLLLTLIVLRNFLLFPTLLLVPFLIIAAIARKLKHRKEMYKVRQAFPDSVKEKILEKQHHRCADCNRVLNVVDWHHRNSDRSDNRESNCVALCPNCHAITTRRRQ